MIDEMSKDITCSETKYRTLFESSSDAIMLLDEKGFFDCNNVTVRMFNCIDKADFCSKHPADLSPPVQPCGTDSMMLANEKITSAMKNGSNHFEWVHQTVDGTEFFADVLLSAMELDGKQVLQAVVRNISDRKKAQQEVARAQNNLKTILSRSPFGVVVIGKDRRIRWANKYVCQLAGVENSDVLIGKHCGEYLCTADQKSCPILDNKQPVDNSERILRRHDGREIPILKTVTEIEIDGEQVMLETFIDITQRKNAEKELESLAKFPSENPNPILRISKDGTVRFSNIAGEILLARWESNIGTKVPQKWRNLITEVIASQKVRELEEEAAGKIFSLIIAPVENTGYVNIYARDITDRKRIEQKQSELIAELQQARKAADQEKAKLSAMISGMEEGVVFADADNRIVAVNEYFCRFTNTLQEKIIGCRIEDIHQSNILQKIIGLIQQFRQNTNSKPYTIQRSLGEAEVIIRIQPIYQDNCYSGVLMNVINVTELVNARKQAEAATAAKSQFLANMSHEIRTPMNAIIGFSDILSEESMPDHQKDFVNTIKESGIHLLQLINDILDYSKIEAGKLEIKKTLFDLPELIKSIDSLVRPEAEKKGLKLELVLQDQLPQQIISDPARLRQCILNLVSNAIKFTQSGCVRLELGIEDKDGKPHFRFNVQDTGIGIPPECQKDIFNSFKQVDDSASRKYEGTGLGLAITKQLTEMLGGELAVESVYGKGSVFSLVIPAGIENDPGELLKDMKGYSQMNDHTKHTKFPGQVLVAEDVPANQKLIRHLLEKMGFEVTMVNNGSEAVQKALSRQFDLIFMDIQMPCMNGYEAAKLIRENSIETPIIALTANAMSNDENQCIIAGCSDYLSKPIDRQKLLDKICRYISPDAPSEKIENVEDQLNGSEKLCLQQTNENIYQILTDVETSEEVIDFETLIARLGDEELIKEIIPIFLSDCKERFEDTRKAVLSRDCKEIRFHAHAIKGAAGNIGANLLSDIASKLEGFGKEDDTESAASIYGALETEYNRVVSFLSQPDWIQKTNKKTIEV